MTREEEIKNTAHKYYSDNIKCYDAFLHGVEWTDENIKEIWHYASKEPQDEYDIMCQDKFGGVWLTDY